MAGEGTGRVRDRFVALCRDAGFEPVLAPLLPNLEDALVEIARSSTWTLLRASNVREAERLGVAALTLAEELPPARLWLAHRREPSAATRSLGALARRPRRAGQLDSASP